MWVRALAAALVLAALAGGCTRSSGKAPPVAVDRAVAARRLVTAYFADVRSANFEGAMARRCAASKTAPAEEQTWLGDERRLVDTAGTPVLDGVRVVPIGRMKPPEQLSDPFDVEASLTYPRGGSGIVFIVLGYDHAHLELCGWASQNSGLVEARTRLDVPNLGQTSRQPEALMPGAARPGERLNADSHGPSGGPTHPHWIDSWSRAWQASGYGGDRVSAIRYINSAWAEKAAAQLLSAVLPAASGTFAVAGLPKLTGVRYLAYTYLWSQIPSVGPYIDRVVMTFGSTVVWIDVAALPVGSDHSFASRYANAVAALARRASASV